MAEEVQLTGTQETGMVRNPLGVIGLSFITLGIYGIFWYYKINKELAAIGKARNTEEMGTNPGTSVLAVTLGVFILVPPFVSMYNTLKRQSAAEQALGVQGGSDMGLVFLLLIFLGPVGVYLLQQNQNGVVQAASGASAPPAPAAPPAA